MKRFKDRAEAGRLLGEKLLSYKNQNPLLLAIPRGGVPIAAAAAQVLQCPWDLLLVKKIGAPFQPELAIGAVSEDGKPHFNADLVKLLSIDSKTRQKLTEQKVREIAEQNQKFRQGRPPEDVRGRVAIIVDDGIATGATLIAAVQLLKQRGPAKIVVAAPVGAEESIERLEDYCDEVVCLEAPPNFMAVGLWYESFNQVEDQEVLRFFQESQNFRSRAASLKTAPRPETVNLKDGEKTFTGELTTLPDMKGVVIFAHGSGSSRLSPRNKYVAEKLHEAGFGTLLFDLLTTQEADDRRLVFDIELLARRLGLATDWTDNKFQGEMPIAYFGASTGAGAALSAAAQTKKNIFAVVSRGGRPDLALPQLPFVSAPTLLIVGAADSAVIPLNEKAKQKLPHAEMVLVPRATHLFEEPGTLDEVVRYAVDWFTKHAPDEHSTGSVVTELQRRAHPLTDPESFEELISSLAKKQIVMLGEATHGTAEFYQLRREISERLIEDHGFTFIAVEGDWPDCQKINDYIHTSHGGNAIEVLKRFERWPTWMWANEEIARLAEWMREKRASFYGLDVYSLFESMDYVNAFAESLGPDTAKNVQAHYNCFARFERDEKAYARHIAKFPEGCRKEVVTNLQNILRLRLDEIAAEEPDLFNVQQSARIAAHAEEYYRAMLFGGPESWNVRDNHMIDTLDILLRRHGGKAIVWAHNSHIGDYHATDMRREGYVNIGGLARERFGADNVSLVGFGTYEGHVLASTAWEGAETVTPLPSARADSWEDYCHQVASRLPDKRFFVLFDPPARRSILGQEHYPHRAVGVVYRTQFESKGHNYVPTIPARRYDAFVFVDKTTALKSVPTHLNKLDFPETWPGGF